MGFKGGNVLGTIALNTSTAGTTSIGTGTNSGTINIGNTNSGAVAIDCGTAGITVGTTANAHTTTVGSTTTTSTTAIQSGSGGITVATSTNGTIGLTSGSGTISIGQGGGTGIVNIGNTTGNTFISGTCTATVASNVNTFLGLETSNDIFPATLELSKNRSGGVITAGDGIGYIYFGGYDGSSYIQTALISVINVGTVAANRVGGRMQFWTHPDSASALASRMVIDSTGEVTINAPDSGTGLTVSGGGITVTTGAVSINSGTGAYSLSTDASATTVNIATGGAAKTVTLGSTTTTSSLALRYGTSDFTLASATGTVMSALDTGEITYPLQVAFLAYNSATDTNVTGAGTAYAPVYDTEVFDQNADYNNGTGVFTAPVTGRYFLTTTNQFSGLTVATTFTCSLVTSNRTYLTVWSRGASALTGSCFTNAFVDMDAADTAFIQVTVSGEAGDTADLIGGATGQTAFGGHLVC